MNKRVQRRTGVVVDDGARHAAGVARAQTPPHDMKRKMPRPPTFSTSAKRAALQLIETR